ncbi:hypothetical protein BU23DRAFT_559112 [Bimuria novae-zelandiae CBS 107.79]|uniref:Uncharacterized protein n=1 Tax=Bimuria novae-zelandiae CBS 107.79 TaxID=1447943 RepID=A0A6A5UTR7_9PLEO|nr:hypothetical protein BU23DRAFT_559112 [Bimuria novae-zelandiae CBS 107.79]
MQPPHNTNSPRIRLSFSYHNIRIVATDAKSRRAMGATESSTPSLMEEVRDARKRATPTGFTLKVIQPKLDELGSKHAPSKKKVLFWNRIIKNAKADYRTAVLQLITTIMRIKFPAELRLQIFEHCCGDYGHFMLGSYAYREQSEHKHGYPLLYNELADARIVGQTM